MDEKLIQAIDSMSDGEKKNLVIHIQNSLIEDGETLPQKARCLELTRNAELVLEHKLNETSRLRIDIMIRRFVAYKMRNEGYTLAVIGRCMNRSHAAVLNLINQMEDFFSLPNMYKDEIAKYEQFDNMAKNGKQRTDA